MSCTCNIDQLLKEGCRCGAMVTERAHGGVTPVGTKEVWVVMQASFDDDGYLNEGDGYLDKVCSSESLANEHIYSRIKSMLQYTDLSDHCTDGDLDYGISDNYSYWSSVWEDVKEAVAGSGSDVDEDGCHFGELTIDMVKELDNYLSFDRWYSATRMTIDG